MNIRPQLLLLLNVLICSSGYPIEVVLFDAQAVSSPGGSADFLAFNNTSHATANDALNTGGGRLTWARMNAPGTCFSLMSFVPNGWSEASPKFAGGFAAFGDNTTGYPVVRQGANYLRICTGAGTGGSTVGTLEGSGVILMRPQTMSYRTIVSLSATLFTGTFKTFTTPGETDFRWAVSDGEQIYVSESAVNVTTASTDFSLPSLGSTNWAIWEPDPLDPGSLDFDQHGSFPIPGDTLPDVTLAGLVYELNATYADAAAESTAAPFFLAISRFGVSGEGDPADDPDDPDDPDGPAELYIAAGQSNMYGMGAKAEPIHLEPHARIKVSTLGTAGWMDSIGYAPGDLGLGNIGPWWAFAHVMAAAKPESNIRIVQISVPGSPLNLWISGGKIYEQKLPLIKALLAENENLELKGIIWHQGESGTGETEISKQAYADMFEQMIDDWRTALGAPDLAIVAGNIEIKEAAGWGPFVNGALADFAGNQDNFAFAETFNRTFSDYVHYEAPSQVELGIEMARKALELENLPFPASLPVVLTTDVIPDWTAPAGSQVLPVAGDAPVVTTQRNTTNLGSSQRLYTYTGNHTSICYLRFTGLPAKVDSAKLVMYLRAVPRARIDLTVQMASADFSESTIAPINAPAPIGETLEVQVVSMSSGVVEIDVTPLISDGQTTLPLIVSGNSVDKALVIDSREGPWPARLVINGPGKLDPWIWIDALGKYGYAGDDSGWVYLPH